MADTPSRKQPIAFRLTPEAVALLRALAERMGISMTSALEVAIREQAEKRGVRPKTTKE